MKKRIFIVLLAFLLLKSTITVRAMESRNIPVAGEINPMELLVEEAFEETEAEPTSEPESIEDKEKGNIEEIGSAEETESANEEESTEETESVSEEESAEETESVNEEESTEETESVSEEESAEETESAGEEESTEETETADENETVEETESAEKTETLEEVVETEFDNIVTEEIYAVSPGYRSIYSESDIRAFLSQRNTDELVGTNEDTETFDSYEDVVEYLREQMKVRQETVSIQVMSGVEDGLGKKVYETVKNDSLWDDVLEENADTPADEGDYIKANLIGNSATIFHGPTILSVTFYFVYTSDAAQEEEVNGRIPSVMDSLNLEGKSDYEKLKIVYDYVVQHITYEDDGTYLCHSTYAALIKGRCVCQGYASLFQRMSKLAGIPTRYITGTGNGVAHAWNIVKLGDVWYNVDATWDEPLKYNYFLKSDLDFRDHQRDEEYLTNDFYTQHTMADISYGREQEDLGDENRSYSFLNIDGGILSSDAMGNPKILIFFSDYDFNSETLLRGISRSEWIKKNMVDVYAINAEEFAVDGISEYRNEKCPEGYIKFGYTTDLTAANALKYYADMKGVDGAVSYPLTVMIDADNQVRYVIEGYLTEKEIDQVYMPLLDEGWQSSVSRPLTSVSLNTNKITLEKGEKYGLRVIYSPADTTDDITVIWSSTDTDVATIDENGMVTAVGFGEADITAEIGEFSVVCNLSVNPSEYTITFISDGTEYTTISFKENEVVTNLPVPVRYGYKFTGWNLNGKPYTEGGKLNSDIILTAGWEEADVLPIPICNVETGSIVPSGSIVTLSSSVSGAQVYYTLNGEDPTVSSKLYESPIIVESDMTIKAIAVKEGEKNSPIAVIEIKVEKIYSITLISEGEVYMTITMGEAETVEELPVPARDGYHFRGWHQNGVLYEVGGKLTENITLTARWEKYETLPSPTSSIKSGSVVERGTMLSLSCSVDDTKIYYTLNGNEPTVTSRLYTEPFTISTDMVIKAIAIKDGYENSPVASFEIAIKTNHTITLMNGNNVYQTINIDENETVRELPAPTKEGYEFEGWYLDGTEYKVGGKVSEDIILNAGWKLAPPVCNITSGSTVAAGTQITLETPVSGAEIYYTYDRTIPDTSSSFYSHPLVFGKGTFLIRAITVKSGDMTSDVATYIFTFEEQEEPEKDWPFTDVDVSPGSWRYDSVKYVYENNIMNGITEPDGSISTFEPESPLTRAMFVTVLYRMAGSPSVSFDRNRFDDVTNSSTYYARAVIWANDKGIVQGYEDGNFGININITREQVAKMLYMYAEVQGYNVSARANINSFPDRDQVSSWATEFMRWAVAKEMITGKNIDGVMWLAPKGEATRAECAAMLMRFLQKYQ